MFKCIVKSKNTLTPEVVAYSPSKLKKQQRHKNPDYDGAINCPEEHWALPRLLTRSVLAVDGDGTACGYLQLISSAILPMFVFFLKISSFRFGVLSAT